MRIASEPYEADLQQILNSSTEKVLRSTDHWTSTRVWLWKPTSHTVCRETICTITICKMPKTITDGDVHIGRCRLWSRTSWWMVKLTKSPRCPVICKSKKLSTTWTTSQRLLLVQPNGSAHLKFSCAWAISWALTARFCTCRPETTSQVKRQRVYCKIILRIWVRPWCWEVTSKHSR